MSYRGNGVCQEFPLTDGADGKSIVYAYEGRTSVLLDGEGYKVDSDRIIFESPPPDGALIALGSRTGTCTSTEAVNRITEAIAQLKAETDSFREFIAANRAYMDRQLSEAAAHTDEVAKRTAANILMDVKNTVDATANDLRDKIHTRMFEMEGYSRDSAAAAKGAAIALNDTEAALAEVLKVCADAQASVAEFTKKTEESLASIDTQLATKQQQATDAISTASATVNSAISNARSSLLTVRDEAIEAVEGAKADISKRVEGAKADISKRAEASKEAISATVDSAKLSIAEKVTELEAQLQAASDEATKKASSAIAQFGLSEYDKIHKDIVETRKQADAIAAQIRRLSGGGRTVS